MPVDNPQFMNKSSSDTLKGLCAMVVVMVHFPEAYQNTLQDAIGSFGYVAVTFFFLSEVNSFMQPSRDANRINLILHKHLPLGK